MENRPAGDRTERVITLIGRVAQVAAQLTTVIIELTRIRW